METHKYWRIVLAYRGMIFLLSMSALLITVLMTYIIPEKYEALALVLITPQERIKLDSSKNGKELLEFPVNQGVPFDVPGKTYIEVMTSQAVVEKIVHVLGLDHKISIPSGTSYKEMIERFRERVKVYIEWTINILKYGRNLTLDPVQKAVKDVQDDLSVSATKNTVLFEITYLDKNPKLAAAVANTAAEVMIEEIMNANENESRSIMVFLESQLRGIEKELEEARLALKVFKERNATIVLSEEYSAKLKILGDLETDFEKSEVKLAGLLQQFTTSHPQVTKLQAERERLLRSIVQLKADFENNPVKEKNLETLKLRVKVTENNYQFIRKEYEEARIQAAHRIIEMRIASPAIPPARPKKPIKYYYAGSALLIAMLIGVGLAFFLESQRARIRSIEDVTEVLHLKVLATIPTIKSIRKV